MRLRFLTVLTLVVCLSLPARASYLLLQEVSAVATGQASALVAGGGHPDSQYHNASNLSFMDGLDLQLALTVYLPQSSYESPTGEVTDGKLSPIAGPSFFAGYKALDWLAVGLAAFPNFGKILEWPEGWEGAYVVEKNTVMTFTINPNVSFGPFKGFAVAAGFDATWGHLSFTRALTTGGLPDDEAGTPNTLTIGAESWSYSGNFGVSYQPAPWVRIGASYRMAYDTNLKGRADFDVTEPWAWRFPDQDVHLTINMPHQANLGARFWPREDLSLELDLWYMGWSVYEEQRLVFEEGGIYEGPGKTREVDVTRQNLSDGMVAALGLSWDITPNYVLRGGLNYDMCVVPDLSVTPNQPDGHRISASVGFGVAFSGFYADVAYKFGYIIPRDVRDVEGVAMGGTFRTYKHSFSLGVGYHFDPADLAR